MGGGLLQLVAYGAQDVYLTGNPQITFFKAVYRRHTNFAIEAIEQTFNGNATFGSRVTCQISRNGDLINRVYLQLKLTNKTQNVYAKYFGLRVINYVEIEIGGQRIDKHYAHWLYIWNELSLPVAKRDGYNQMVGAFGGLVNYVTDATKASINDTLYVPLEFWFCRNVGLALPLIALQYHEVKINLNFETEDKCKLTGGDAGSPTFTASLWVDYIFLDTDERRRFAQLSHEYLIEQLQFTGEEAVTTTSVKAKLNFNHPCKELVWFIYNNDNNTNNWFNYTTKVNAIVAADNSTEAYFNKLHYDGLTGNNSEVLYAANPVNNAKLVLNGNDRFSQRTGAYFNLVQPFQHHENVPANAGINVYSFALKPEEHQPSGTLNMSRIDTAVLNLDIYDKTTALGYSATLKYVSTNCSLFVYATNYNVLRILSGMGGLAYSN
jgi:Large eukaryotic DNA virus major capsid protein/Major capsid protein N-terminus